MDATKIEKDQALQNWLYSVKLDIAPPLQEIMEITTDPKFKDSTGIYYLSKPFIQAFEKAVPKIQQTTDWYVTDTCAGIMMTDSVTVFYLANPNTDRAEDAVSFMFFIGDRTRIVGVGSEKESKFGGFFPSKENPFINDLKELGGKINYMKLLLYFIKNCEVETKVVNPKEKYRTATDKHYNETKTPFTILDCNWFTTLIRETGFKVTGHYRWQPYGAGMKFRKLIWIDEFDKEGYVRRAKIEKENS